MTHVLITVDTELSAGRHSAGVAAGDNFLSSIIGSTVVGEFGIGWQMDRLNERGLRAVYFVDPMPGLIFGPQVVERIVTPILERGHEVQLHIHTEWLEWAKESPVEGRTGKNVNDFSLEDQVTLIQWAANALVAAGAPRPIAFRAGNFGANDDTLRALARLDVVWDSSFNPDYAHRGCAISASVDMVDPTKMEGVYEVPVAGFWDRPSHFRPAQVCAISAAEMRQALRHAGATGAHSFSLVTHSFEMLSRDRKRPNRAVMNRFVAMCDDVAANGSLRSSGFCDLPPPLESGTSRPRLGPDLTRTAMRITQQLLASWRYEHGWRPE